ncbi:UDP-N-acetylglucosamine--N-acetylmuramyl-(pentapeptide) pyrophosphoryl-undecaprenol N-acetylglucosamine transferase [Patescibacteria group bacterium]|nr:UDP-N-acetylglucosamine--N-acetylmuramyl-(pentapeptide) pyrophosphoryl-undecaprenol N-acetylglucosamine transferase [Patescibacteria group bacterium]
MKIVMTGGHHSSALPVIKELKKRQTDVDIIWLGHRRSQRGNASDTLEYTEITSMNIKFYNLNAGKFYRTIDPVRLIKIPLGFLQALVILIKEKPDIILSFGGYLAVPPVIMGWLLGIPSVTHEQTVTSGYANKLISKFVKRIFVSWPDSENQFDSGKVVFTGLPLREAIFKQSSDSFKADNSLPYVYVTAGKTGSHLINGIVQKCLLDLLSICNVIHQCGDHSQYKDIDVLQGHYEKIKDNVRGKYFLRKFVFEDEIGEALTRASVVISRAGAHTIMELLYLGKPAVLIPIPWASHDEQNKNAQMLRKYKLCEIIDEANLTPKLLVDTVNKILASYDNYLEVGKLNSKFKVNNAASLIIDEVMKVVGS